MPRVRCVVPDAPADPRWRTLPAVRSGVVGVLPRDAAARPADGPPVGALCVLAREPREWTDEDVALLRQLATRWPPSWSSRPSPGVRVPPAGVELAIDGGGVGAFDWDLVTGGLIWDDRLLELFGTSATRSTNIEAFNAVVHPDDLPRVTTRWRRDRRAAAVQGGVPRPAARRPDPLDRRAAGRWRRPGTAVRVLGAAYDTTAEQQGEARVGRVLEAMTPPSSPSTPSGGSRYVNAEAERLLSATRDELVGGRIWERSPPPSAASSRPSTGEPWRPASRASFEAYYPRRWTPGTRCGPGRAPTGSRCTSSTSPSDGPPRTRRDAARRGSALLARVTGRSTERG